MDNLQKQTGRSNVLRRQEIIDLNSFIRGGDNTMTYLEIMFSTFEKVLHHCGGKEKIKIWGKWNLVTMQP